MLAALDPELALWLILTGVLLIYVECNRPGGVLPGAAGVLLAMLGVGALARGPSSLAAAAWLVLGLLLLAADLLLRARGLMAMAAIAALGVGLHGLKGPRSIGWGTAGGVAAIFVPVSWWLGRVALAARRNKRTGRRDQAEASSPAVRRDDGKRQDLPKHPASQPARAASE